MKNPRGQTSLLALVVTAGLSAFVALAFAKALAGGFRSLRHQELKGDVNAIRQHVLEAVDCAKTLPDPAACPGTPLLLRDGSGNPLTAPLDDIGTGRIGAWNLLTECDPANRTLVVRAARRRGAVFASDPFTGRTYDYTPANSLHLFGGPNVKLCQGAFGQPRNVLKVRGTLYRVDHAVPCDPAINSQHLLPHRPHVARHWVGQAWCPEGYLAVGGGGEAEPHHGAVLLQTRPVENNGRHGWEYNVCMIEPVSHPPQESYDRGVWAGCVRME